jgi:hypothetical protein
LSLVPATTSTTTSATTSTTTPVITPGTAPVTATNTPQGFVFPNQPILNPQPTVAANQIPRPTGPPPATRQQVPVPVPR